ncbi:hypothetical protein DPM13_12555 [Paracoccus mutanolyticus]|uniref:Uncharacterized protein n=1 Tax=Paracoccus mutanolyticus TaxID=1499308 RepID=A0ABN5M6Z2_9RHOB|nr:hypothetical protein [Paracoccus mutanolyticus]AWX93632.1 hypothetical protein DPM13_12555 [Paracoccus mutanolyticus]
MVNNRGVANDSWFYMARGHAFEIQAMKERMVEIAASRIDRGKLTYGPSRAELERALREGRAVREKPLQGQALHEAMTQIAANIVTLRLFSSMARQVRDSALAAKIAHAAEVLSRGGIVEPLQEEPMEAQAIQTRGDLAAYYDRWLDNAERGIDRLPEAERADLRRALYEAAASVSRELGDDRGAALMQEPAREPVHGTQIGARPLPAGLRNRWPPSCRGAALRHRRGSGADRPRPAAVTERMTQRAANAWQERDWTRKASSRWLDQRLDLVSDTGRRRPPFGGFHHGVDGSLERRNIGLCPGLGAMPRACARTATVAFQNDDHAARFARDLKERYGDDLMARLARGDDRALALDIADPADHRHRARDRGRSRAPRRHGHDAEPGG